MLVDCLHKSLEQRNLESFGDRGVLVQTLGCNLNSLLLLLIKILLLPYMLYILWIGKCLHFIIIYDLPNLHIYI